MAKRRAFNNQVTAPTVSVTQGSDSSLESETFARTKRECNWFGTLCYRFDRSTAAECQCDSRLLQDRLAHDGWDPGTCINCHPNSNSYANGDSYSYSDCYSHCNGYTYGNGHCDCYTDAYFHTETNPDAKRYGFAKAATDSAAAPVGPGGERALGWNALSSTRWQK